MMNLSCLPEVGTRNQIIESLCSQGTGLRLHLLPIILATWGSKNWRRISNGIRVFATLLTSWGGKSTWTLFLFWEDKGAWWTHKAFRCRDGRGPGNRACGVGPRTPLWGHPTAPGCRDDEIPLAWSSVHQLAAYEFWCLGEISIMWGGATPPGSQWATFPTCFSIFIFPLYSLRLPWFLITIHNYLGLRLSDLKTKDTGCTTHCVIQLCEMSTWVNGWGQNID